MWLCSQHRFDVEKDPKACILLLSWGLCSHPLSQEQRAWGMGLGGSHPI